MKTKIRKVLALASIAGLLATLSLPTAATAQTDATTPSQSLTDTYDFFADKYPQLSGKSSVFQSVEFSEIYNYFLGGKYTGTQSYYSNTRNSGSGKYRVDVKSGNHIFLIGGTWNPELQAAIGSINDVAKEYGIPAIYNFDPHLDGKANSSIDIFAPVGAQKPGETYEEYSYRNYYRQRGDALAKALYHWDGVTDPTYGDLNGDVGGNTWSADDIATPSIVIWNKDGANHNPVVAELTWMLAQAKDEATFKATLRDLFNTISVNGKAKDVVNVSQTAYFLENEQKRYKAQYSGSNIPLLSVDGQPLYLDAQGNVTKTDTGTPYASSSLNLFTAADTYTPIEVVTYEELRGILASKGNYAVVFSGLWCPNGMSALRNIHDWAVKYNVQKVYYFDVELDSTFNNSVTSIRNSDRTLISGLYIDLFQDNFTNIGLGKEFQTRFDEAYLNYIASENQRRAEAGQPLLTDAEKQLLRTTNAGNSGDGLSIYEKQPGYGNYTPYDPDTTDSVAVGRDANTSSNGTKPVANARVASRFQTPTLILYNKDHKNAQGQPAPVISKFEELWNSGANLAVPGTFGYDAAAKGRIFEQQEYWFSGKDTPTVSGVLTFNGTSPDTLHSSGGYNYNTSNNAPTPHTSHDAYKISSSNDFDKRLEYTPIVSRTYWPGLNEVLNTFGVSVLDDLVAKASALKADNYTAASYTALTSAIDAAEKASRDVKNSDAAAKAKDDAKLNAPKGWTQLTQTATVARLTSTQQVGSYEELSGPIKAAYTQLETALNGLAAKEGNPGTGSNPLSPVPVVVATAAALLAFASVKLRAKASGTK